MKITQIKWKGLYACCLENELLKAVFLPQCGGKTVSLVYKPADFEAAAQTYRPYLQIKYPQIPFDEGDASGFDEAFPTIIEAAGGEKTDNGFYMDHGEIWRAPFEVQVCDERLEMFYESYSNAYVYRKTVWLEQNRLCFAIYIENLRERVFPCTWTFHGLMRYEEDMRLFYPDEVTRFLNVENSKELGMNGTFWQTDAGYDFTKVPPRVADTELKYYAAEPVREGRCGYIYPSQHVRCTLEYNADSLPYLGMWITAGKFRGDYNCAWEPSNGFYDGIETAVKNGKYTRLKKGEPLEITYSLRLETI